MTRNIPAKWMLAAATVTALIHLLTAILSPAAEAVSVHMKFAGANQSAQTMPRDLAPAKSAFLYEDDGDPATRDEPVAPIAWYRDVYPGIDLICFATDFNVEYCFVVSPGGDTSLIKFAFGESVRLRHGHAGSVVAQSAMSQIVQGAPVVNIVGEDNAKRSIRGRAVIRRDKTVGLDVEAAFTDHLSKHNDTRMNVVPGGGQPGGPRHDFFASKLETNNEQFLRFLNDAQANLKGPRGDNMFFDNRGNVWINPEMKPGRDEMFTLAASQLTYDPTKPEGERYAHRRPDNRNDPFADHPVGGVSWFGAAKYANWLTIFSERGIAERCYTEGTNVLDWAPTIATNWSEGRFSEAERQLWLSAKGFRLPMIAGDAPAVTTNFYNEFYKAAAWNRTTNTLYGFGRDTFAITDANALTNAEQKVIGSTPVGYYDGDTFLGVIRTRASQNIYGLFDLSGNASEWTTDFARKGSTLKRMATGGSFKRTLQPVYRCESLSPSDTDSAGGFRMFTTYMPQETLYIHILYSFYAGDAAPLIDIIPEEEVEPVTPPEETGGAEQIEPERRVLDVTPPAISYKETEEELPPIPGEDEDEPPVLAPVPITQIGL